MLSYSSSRPPIICISARHGETPAMTVRNSVQAATIEGGTVSGLPVPKARPNAVIARSGPHGGVFFLDLGYDELGNEAGKITVIACDFLDRF